MGCSEVKDKFAELICEFEPKNVNQQNYCIKLKDELTKHKLLKTCKWVICSRPEIPFSIKLKINNKINEIQSTFDDNEEQLNKTLQDILKLLGEQKEEEKTEEKRGE